MTAPDAKHVLTLDRTLDAPAAKLCRCWTEPDLLKQWFCPKPWYVSDAMIDLTPGGAFFTAMNGPDGERFENVGVVLAFEPQRRLVTTDAILPGWVPADKAFMTAHVTFDDAGGDRTRYVARAMHWNEENPATTRGDGLSRRLGHGRQSASGTGTFDMTKSIQ